MKLPWVSLAIAMSMACGTSSKPVRPDDGPPPPALGVPMNTDYKPGSRNVDVPSSRPDDGLRVELEHGVLDQNEVEATIERHFRKLTRCYERAGHAQAFVDGQITLKFLVEPGGTVSDVLIVDNELGSYPVERCLVSELREIKFRPPGGRKGASFEYPIRFRSTNEIAVVDWPYGLVSEDVDSLLAAMTPCPPLGTKEVFVIAYIKPNGLIASAGLKSSGAIDPEAGRCALEQIQGWRLRGEPGAIVRTGFRLRVSDASRLPAVTSPPAANRGKAPRGKPTRSPATRQGRRTPRT